MKRCSSRKLVARRLLVGTPYYTGSKASVTLGGRAQRARRVSTGRARGTATGDRGVPHRARALCATRLCKPSCRVCSLSLLYVSRHIHVGGCAHGPASHRPRARSAGAAAVRGRGGWRVRRCDRLRRRTDASTRSYRAPCTSMRNELPRTATTCDTDSADDDRCPNREGQNISSQPDPLAYSYPQGVLRPILERGATGES